MTALFATQTFEEQSGSGCFCQHPTCAGWGAGRLLRALQQETGERYKTLVRAEVKEAGRAAAGLDFMARWQNPSSLLKRPLSTVLFRF